MDKVMKQPAEPMQVQQVDLIEQCASKIFKAWVQKQDSIKGDADIESDPEYGDTLVECMVIDSRNVVENSREESEIEESEEPSVEEQVKELFGFLAEHQNQEDRKKAKQSTTQCVNQKEESLIMMIGRHMTR